VEAVLAISRDLTEHVLASEGLREAQRELEHVNRLTTMGQLTASIAHEVNQPIAATVTNAQAALRWLDAQPPDLGETRRAVARIVNNGIRAGDILDRIRGLIKKVPARTDRFDINDTIIDIVALLRSELSTSGVSFQTQFAQGLLIQGDRVQLQQVILNLIVNAVEAMSGVRKGARELWISTEKNALNGALVAVRDSGPGLERASLEHLFDAFYTTKSSGMGMGLSICRSIIEAHGGRIWAEANVPQGATFQFSLPCQAAS
jgi:C4-dicarboxylate-specific signal transduction histidine kinase